MAESLYCDKDVAATLNSSSASLSSGYASGSGKDEKKKKKKKKKSKSDDLGEAPAQGTKKIEMEDESWLEIEAMNHCYPLSSGRSGSHLSAHGVVAYGVSHGQAAAGSVGPHGLRERQQALRVWRYRQQGLRRLLLLRLGYARAPRSIKHTARSPHQPGAFTLFSRTQRVGASGNAGTGARCAVRSLVLHVTRLAEGILGVWWPRCGQQALQRAAFFQHRFSSPPSRTCAVPSTSTSPEATIVQSR